MTSILTKLDNFHSMEKVYRVSLKKNFQVREKKYRISWWLRVKCVLLGTLFYRQHWTFHDLRIVWSIAYEQQRFVPGTLAIRHDHLSSVSMKYASTPGLFHFQAQWFSLTHVKPSPPPPQSCTAGACALLKPFKCFFIILKVTSEAF